QRGPPAEAVEPIVDGLVAFRRLVPGPPVIPRRHRRRLPRPPGVQVIDVTALEPPGEVRREFRLRAGLLKMLPGEGGQFAVALHPPAAVDKPPVLDRFDDQGACHVRQGAAALGERAEPDDTEVEARPHPCILEPTGRRYGGAGLSRSPALFRSAGRL